MFNAENFQEKILELIKDCSMNLSEDIYRKLKKYEAIADNATSKNVLTHEQLDAQLLQYWFSSFHDHDDY